MKNLQDIIDQTLLDEQSKRETRERSGMWSPSQFGKCYRNQYWNRKNEPQTNKPDLLTLRRFKLGNLIHSYVQSHLHQDFCEKKIAKDDILGYADYVEDCVYDIKSVSDWEFGYISKPTYNVEEEKPTNCLQVCTYAWILGIKEARLFFVNIKNLSSKECEIRLPLFIPQVENELKILRGWWDKNELPPGIPRAYRGKECSYCAFKDKCFAFDGDKTIKEEK